MCIIARRGYHFLHDRWCLLGLASSSRFSPYILLSPFNRGVTAPMETEPLSLFIGYSSKQQLGASSLTSRIPSYHESCTVGGVIPLMKWRAPLWLERHCPEYKTSALILQTFNVVLSLTYWRFSAAFFVQQKKAYQSLGLLLCWWMSTGSPLISLLEQSSGAGSSFR